MDLQENEGVCPMGRKTIGKRIRKETEVWARRGRKLTNFIETVCVAVTADD